MIRINHPIQGASMKLQLAGGQWFSFSSSSLISFLLSLFLFIYYDFLLFYLIMLPV